MADAANGNGGGFRRRALDALLPMWSERRLVTADKAAALAFAKETHKAAVNAQQRVENDLDHVATCTNPDCLICEALAKNAAPQDTEDGADEQDEEADDTADLSDWQEVRDPLALPPGPTPLGPGPGQVVEAEFAEVGG